jgi:hypothetical protein
VGKLKKSKMGSSLEGPRLLALLGRKSKVKLLFLNKSRGFREAFGRDLLNSKAESNGLELPLGMAGRFLLLSAAEKQAGF